METEKPRAKPGTFCPLWRKDVSKVCHTCAWWDRIRVELKTDPPQEVDHWACAINLHTIVTRDVGIGMGGIQKATEDFRNRVSRMGAVAGLVQHDAPSQPLINGDDQTPRLEQY